MEEETLHDLETFARMHGVAEDVLSGHRVLKWDKEIRSWRLGGTFPACPVVAGNEAEACGDMATEAKEPFIVMEPDKVEGDFPYFVIISRSGFRRLHLSGACAVKQEKCIETVGVHSISEGCADAICKHCQPKVGANESSSSGSEAAELP